MSVIFFPKSFYINLIYIFLLWKKTIKKEKELVDENGIYGGKSHTMLLYSKLSFTALYCNYSHWVSNFIFSMLNLSSDFGFFFFFFGGWE